MTIENPTILVTGASRGIGRATAILAAEMGVGVIVNYVGSRDAAEYLAGSINASGGRALAVQADVGIEADVLRLFEAVDGFGTLVGVVNNAGILDKVSRLDEMSLARLQRMFAVNVIGSFLVAREAVKRMSTRHGGQGGAIVNVASAASVLGGGGQYVDYAASKGAIDTFTLGLAREVAAEGIRVNAVRPGIIDTDIHASGGMPNRVAELRDSLPMKREGTSEEVARAIMWLLSDDASYTTGSILSVTGGR